MNFVKVISTRLKESKGRWIKVLRMGKSDVQESVEVGPFGNDSNPLKDFVAVYSPTGEIGKTAIIGYINRNQLSEPGENRSYSLKSDGSLSFYTWMKNNGTMEIGGDTDFMVRFSELETGFNELKSDHNSLVHKWNTFAAAYVPGGPSVVGLPPTALTDTASTADISGAKIEEIKTI